MLPLIMLQCFLAISQPVKAQEDYNTIIAVVDRDFSSLWDPDISSTVKSFVSLASQIYMEERGLSVKFVNGESFFFGKGENELLILLTIAPCSRTWGLHHRLKKDNVLQVSITDANCPRLPKMLALTIPLMNGEEQISQIILDLRTENVLNWKEAIIIYDDSIGSNLADRVMKVLTDEDFNEDDRQTFPSVSTGIYKLDEDEVEDPLESQILDLCENLAKSRVNANFLGFLKPENMGLLLEMAQRFGLVHTRNQWVFYIMDLSKNISSYAPLVNEGSNIAFLYTTPKSESSRPKHTEKHASTTRRRIISANKDMQSYGGSLFQQEVGQLIFILAKSLKQLKDAEFELYSKVSEEEWEALKPTPMDHRDALLSYLKENMKADNIWDDGQNEELLCCRSTLEWHAAAVESWGLAIEEVPTIFDVANWNPKIGFISWDYIFPHVHHGFRGKKIKVATFHQPPWHTLYLNDSGGIVKHQGLIFEILDELARNLNFSYTLLYQQTSGNGIYFDSKKQLFPTISEKSKNYSLLVEHTIEIVHRREAMLGAAAFVASSRLRTLVNLTTTVATEKHAFLTSRPQVLSRALIFMAPFSPDTWLCIAVSILVMGPVLYWVHHFSPYYDYHGLRYKHKKARKVRRKLAATIKLSAFNKIWKCIWYIYGALLQQGGIQVPMADSGRIVIGTWWLVVIVVMTTYCGNLVAFLTFPRVSSTVSSIENLIDTLKSSETGTQEGLTLGIIDEAVDKIYLKEAADSRLQYLSSKAQVHEISTKENNRSTERKVLERVRRGKHVLIARISHLLLLAEEDYLSTKRCDFYIGGETFLDENLVMVVSKTCPYLSLINEEIKKMHHVGLIQKWTSDSLPKKGLCKVKSHERNTGSGGENEKATNREVNLDDMQGSFFVLIIGCFIALITLSLECIWYRRGAIRESLVIRPFLS